MDNIIKCNECKYRVQAQAQIQGVICSVEICTLLGIQTSSDGFCHFAEAKKPEDHTESKPRQKRAGRKPKEAKELRHKREALGLTQVELADIIGCTSNAISLIESARTRRGKTMDAMRAYFDSMGV